MWNQNSATIEKSAPVLFITLFLVFFQTCTPALSQQHIIANKDRTRPEINESFYRPALITGISVTRMNGYNEVNWMALREYDTRKYIVEYSLDGIDFTSAGEMVANNGSYSFRHSFLENDMLNDPAMLYRIRIEQINNTAYYSDLVLLEGDIQRPVKIYPTIIQGTELNIEAEWPVEKISVINSAGQLVFAKDVNGKDEHMSLTVPSFGKGMYFVTFYGKGWKSTDKFIVP